MLSVMPSARCRTTRLLQRKRSITARSVLAAAAVLLFGFVVAGCSSSPSTLSTRSDDSLRVATYNVHYILLGKQSGAWSVGDWERRKGPLNTAFGALDADIIAFQEMESFSRGNDGDVNLTLDWLLENNTNYAAAAVGHWREFPSTQPILYRKSRLKMLDQGWFFFSETPDIIYSRTFNGSYPAFASWSRFEVLESGKNVTVVNVHFEFKSFSNRNRSAELVAERIGPLIDAGENVLLAGDINAWRGMQPIETLEEVGLSFLPVRGTTYHVNHGINLMGAIDHIAHTTGLEVVGEPVVLRRKFDGEWPSDHYPVIADFRFKQGKDGTS